MTQLKNFVNSLQNKSVTIIGMGVSNTPLIRLLLEHHITLSIRDKSPAPSLQTEFESQGATFQTGGDYLEHITEDIIFRTPGVSPNTPQLLKAKEQGKQITSEMQEFFHLCPCPIFAITGSDGKTTTTTLIAKFLEASGKKVFLGGNIGQPLLCQVDEITPDDFAVVELSSFQLMDLNCNPDVAVVTNLSPNHLDYHKDMEEYVKAKTNIFTNQTPNQTVIFNMDNMDSLALLPLKKGKVGFFSRQKESLSEGTYLKDNTIYLSTNGTDTPILPLEKIKVKGVHNIENFMTAIFAVKDYCTPQQICQVAETFYGVEHRMEFLREHNGISYYNDSIGTSPTRTIAGLHSFEERILLIAGGYDKGIPFHELGTEICGHVKHLILVGNTAEKIKSAVEESKSDKMPPCGLEGTLLSTTVCETLTESVEKATTLAKEGDSVVLSPACAAFDQFKNFAERGNFYRDLVENL